MAGVELLCQGLQSDDSIGAEHRRLQGRFATDDSMLPRERTRLRRSRVDHCFPLKTAFCLLVVFGLAGVPAVAQQRIAGVVRRNGTRERLRDVEVSLTGEVLGEPETTQTDAEGRYSFPHLSPGDYTVATQTERFYPEKVQVSLGPRATRHVDFDLTPISSLHEQVTVRAEKGLLDQSRSSTVISLDRKRISELPEAQRMQLTDIVKPFVASAVASHDNFVHLRGNELSLNTFINGVSFFDNPHQLFTPGISADIIQSVNVITGGFPAEFGNRFGGILDIVTRSGFDMENQGHVTLGGSTFQRNNFSFDYGGHTGHLGYLFFGQGFESGRFLNTPSPQLLHDFGRGARSFAQIDFRPGEKDSFRLLLTGDGTNFELPNTPEDASRGRDFFQRNREQTAILSWDHVFSVRSTLSTSLYERYTSARLLPTSDPVSIQAQGLRNDTTLGLKSDYSLLLGSRQTIKTGVDLTLFRLREDYSFDPRENEIDIGTFDFGGRKTGGQAALYFQDEVRLLDHLTANLGLRYDQYSLVTGASGLSPRINLAWGLQDGSTVLHFAYNRFFAPPPIENLLLSSALGFEGHPPQVSHSNHFEAGISHSVAERFVVGLTGYVRNDENSFETTELANVRIFAPTTFARGKAFGLEFTSRFAEIQPLGLSGYLNYTAQRAFQTGPVSGGFTVEQVAPGETGPAAFDQIHTAAAGVAWHERRTGFWARTELEYGSGTPATLQQDGEEVRLRLPQHLIANLSFGIGLFNREQSRLNLQFNIENLTNRVYQIAKESEFTPIQYSAARFVSGSLSLSF